MRPARYALIAGTSFCGSTLLAMLLNSHPEMASISEMQGPMGPEGDAYRCSCGAVLRDCRFWQQVAEQVRRHAPHFSLERWDFLYELGGTRVARQLLTRSLRANRLDRWRDALVRRRAAWRRRLRAIGANNEAFIDGVLAVTGKRVFIDATKDPLRARFIDQTTRFRPLVIHLVRDAPGFVNSYVKNTGGSATRGIRLWKRMAAHCRRLARELPAERMLRLRYEDLCTAPARELERITRFLGTAPYPANWDPTTVPHHLIGNRMRLRPLQEIRLDESWRAQLPASTRGRVERRTAAWRRSFGYA